MEGAGFEVLRQEGCEARGGVGVDEGGEEGVGVEVGEGEEGAGVVVGVGAGGGGGWVLG